MLFPVLFLRAGLFILIQVTSLVFVNLFAVFFYYLELGDVGSGVVAGHAVLANYTGDMTIVFFYS